MTEWHIRYRGPGVMIYWHVEKKSACIYSQLKRCSSSEVDFVNLSWLTTILKFGSPSSTLPTRLFAAIRW